MQHTIKPLKVDGAELQKRVLELVVDGSNAQSSLSGLFPAMADIDKAKNLNADVFPDDVEEQAT